MPRKPDETHDPSLRSWVESANEDATEFPIQNLPLGVFDRGDEEAVIGCAIGDQVLDLQLLSETGALDRDEHDPLTFALELESLNLLMALEPEDWSALRRRLSDLLREGNDELRGNAALRERALVPMDSVRWLPPCETGDYTDFYASVHHATNVGSMFRPDNPLLPNYKWIPIGYHGRSSSIVVSGSHVRRPIGQLMAEGESSPAYGPCRLFDYELELGCYVGGANGLGEPVTMDDAAERIFGVSLLNDWSARDMQKWEYQPLGPFLAKSFATTVSPLVVTADALAPFRVPRAERAAGDPAPLDHLRDEFDDASGGLDITVEAHLSSAQMREKGMTPVQLSVGSFRHMYWTFAQMLAHHGSNGCNLQPGDLLGSGTISGPERGSRGCMLELTWDGDPWATPPVSAPGTSRTPIMLPTGEQRKFLADGDEVILRAYCERDGYRRIGFGECRGIVEPAGH
ncbi:MAG: fumarylacetoacetase [Planctomycetota bacterium]